LMVISFTAGLIVEPNAQNRTGGLGQDAPQMPWAASGCGHRAAG
jgi:hypothetical protein